MKKIVFKIIIFISIKKQQQKMSNTSEIVNSVFDWRSVGGIIMSYIETPKEEYKKVYDLQIQALKDKKEDDDVYNPDENPCLHFPYILKPVGLNDEEIDQVVEILLEKLGCDGLYPQYKRWLKDNYNCDNDWDYEYEDYQTHHKFDSDVIFDWLQRDKLWNLCDNELTLRFKLLCDYNTIIHTWMCGPNKDRKKIEDLKHSKEIESRVKSAFNKIVYQEMWNDGTLNNESEEEYYDSEEYNNTFLEDCCAMLRPEESDEECEDEYDY